MAPKPGPMEQATICWECKNTNRYDCPWFDPDDPQPVPGWVAEPRTMYSGSDTYLVKECPKFEPLPPRTVLSPPPAVSIPGVRCKKTKYGAIRWEATLMHHRKNYYLGSFTNLEDAVTARVAAEEAIARGEEPERDSPNRLEPGQKGYPPGYQCGVRFTGSYWVARISHNGKAYHLGHFTTEEKAIEARLDAEEAIKRGEEPKPKRKEPKTYPPSCYPGVRRRSRYWVAHITHKGKQYHLGYFKTEEKAIAARKAAEEAIKRGEIPAH